MGEAVKTHLDHDMVMEAYEKKALQKARLEKAFKIVVGMETVNSANFDLHERHAHRAHEVAEKRHPPANHYRKKQ